MQPERGLFPHINIESEPPDVVERLFPRRLEWFQRMRQEPRLKYLRLADYWFSDAPAKLNCRFFAHVADAWCQAIMMPRERAGSPIALHTEREVRQIYARQRRQNRSKERETSDVQFDLHNVYVCMEAQLMDPYSRRMDYDIHSPRWYDEESDDLTEDPLEPGLIIRGELNRQAGHAREQLAVVGEALD